MSNQQEHIWEGIKYSAQRIDITTISISGAGIYLCLQLLKFAVDNKHEVNCLIKISALCFLIAVIFNVIPQVFGSETYRQVYCINEISSLEEKEESDEELERLKQNKIKHELKSDLLNKFTKIFTYSSITSMIIGVILISIYLLTNF